VGAARAKAKPDSANNHAASGRPPRPPETLVARERLYAALDSSSKLPLTLLVAPAGTGKTVLLSAWAERHIGTQAKVVWVATHDHHLLKTRLCEAVNKKTGPVLKVLEDAVSAGVVPDIVVVDDAHLLARQQLQLLEEILRSVPEAVRLVLASRRDLPLPVLELDLAGRASTLRISDLRFNDEEATNLVRAHAELASADDISQLRTRTAGWAAALVLAARSLAANTPGAGILSPALVTTDQPVLDLLLGEAFTTLTEPSRQMLLSTFADPFTSASRAVMLSGNPAAGDLLRDLTSSGLLVTAYSAGEGVIYRYHPLLVELLRRRVVSHPADAEVVRLAHLRAAGNEEAQGQYAAALTDAVEARDTSLITRLLLEYGPEILTTGDFDAIGAAFDALPGGYVVEHPYLLGVQGLHRRCTGDVSGAVMISARATRAASALGAATDNGSDEDHALRADALMLRLWQSRYGWQDAEATIADAHAVLGCEHSGGNPSGHRARLSLSPARMSWLMVELAAAETWVDDLTSASIHLDEALVSARLAGHRNLVTAGLAHRAVIEYSRGDVRSAATTAQSALDHEDPEQVSEDYSVRAHVVLGLSAFNRLDLEAAHKWHERVEGSAVSSTDSVVAAMRMLLRACLLVEAGDLDVARLELTANPAAAGPLPAFLSRDLCLIRYRCAALVRDTAAAGVQVEALRQLGFGDDADLLEAVGIAKNKDDRSAAKLLGLSLAATSAAHPVLRTAVAGLRVSMLLRATETASAREALVTVMNQVTPQQTLQALTPAASEPAFLELLAQVAGERDANPYSAVVLETLSSHQSVWQEFGGSTQLAGYFVKGSEDGDGLTTPAGPRLEHSVSIPAQPARYAVLDGIPVKLTAREADVLGQLALGSSYTEIAKDLYITENTVKTHLASLYRKLAVDKRSAALRVARSLGLLT
jgi:LuxR family maltose regulon positive regulatory protein